MTRISQIFLCIAAINCAEFDDETYCRYRCHWERPHLLCAFKGKCEKTLKPIPLSDMEKQHLLDEHNYLRRLVARGEEVRGLNGIAQPPAANMMELEWSSELEYIAQCQVNHCTNPDSYCLNKADGTTVEQNYWASAFYTSIDYRLKGSYEQVKKFDPAYIPRFDNGLYDTAEYSKMMWADSIEIGCARGWCMKYYLLPVDVIVCNYAPGGNVRGAPMYEMGLHCSNCPRGYWCGLDNSYGLCTRMAGSVGVSNQPTFKIIAVALLGMYLVWNYSLY